MASSYTATDAQAYEHPARIAGYGRATSPPCRQSRRASLDGGNRMGSTWLVP